ncbi:MULTISPECIES: UvrD-helicase domain-containing protein [Pseudomonas syringae group]|uniref:DNA 3'-5' helicase II n=1 Tax=Pseudomonas syringae pv. ribicola TaxID=55398 RepID=A0A0P9YFR1_PSESI|nr:MULTISPECIES: UvrD-helicase domain-containing protein [Pseudomonas syringae group]KPL63939.1 hypothetical protein PVFL_14330 [Pseudomonas viridiflava]KPY44615.1 Uncharacterized protein ALO47_00021 [Pseudomonas syringae pv. ribicola]KPZ23008.1 Uncharacterized protein ALO56_02245 [Pseudomonas viridiflava]
MPDPYELLALGNAAVVAPAGHGKTEIITSIAALGRRALILTHTHAGVHAIRARLKRHGVSLRSVAVDTIAGWCMRYAHSFPSVARPPDGTPRNGAEWDQLYRGLIQALDVTAIHDVIAASYDRILIDEYQDCGQLQHQLSVALSRCVPTTIFGDPMQGIFEFAGANLQWAGEVHQDFPLAGTLEIPYRWAGRNPALGEWIAEVREQLIRGHQIDLADPRIRYRESGDAFDMGTLFDGIDGREGSFAAIHCNKTICYRLASAANGGYQAIEEVAANRLGQLAGEWDRAADGEQRKQSLQSLLNDCFHKRRLADGEIDGPEALATMTAIRELVPSLGEGSGAEQALQILNLCRRHLRWKLYRSELWRDAERAFGELASLRVESMAEAVDNTRQRASLVGRRMPTRTVSTPLLLKGLEFDHVVVPDASHFLRERNAQAKLFYVAISRATHSLTISSPDRFIRFPVPVI